MATAHEGQPTHFALNLEFLRTQSGVNCLRMATAHEGQPTHFDLNFEFDADKVIRPFYETIKSGRIKKDAVYPGTAKGKELGR